MYHSNEPSSSDNQCHSWGSEPEYDIDERENARHENAKMNKMTKGTVKHQIEQRIAKYYKRYKEIPQGFKNLVYKFAGIYKYEIYKYRDNKETGPKKIDRIERAIEKTEWYLKEYNAMTFEFNFSIMVYNDGSFVRTVSYDELMQFNVEHGYTGFSSCNEFAAHYAKNPKKFWEKFTNEDGVLFRKMLINFINEIV